MPLPLDLPRHAALGIAGLSLITGTACSSDTGTAPALATGNQIQIQTASLAPNRYNVLSNVITFIADNADSARVVYSSPSDTTAATPFVPVQRIEHARGTAQIAVLGLLPNTTYDEVLQVFGPGGSVSTSFSATTPALSSFVQGITLKVSGTFSPGYTLVSPISYPPSDSAVMVAFDGRGRIRWYRTFPPGTGSSESKLQHNGHYTIALGESAGYDGMTESFTEFLPSGQVVASYAAPKTEYTDPHDFWITGSGATKRAHFFSYTPRQFDYSSLGGPSSGIGYGHQVTRQSTGGSIEFRWDAWDHYSIIDWIEPTGVAPPFDFDHPNSLDFDADSNYIVSFRNLGAIIKLNAQTGAMMWQFSGRLNQFTILNDPLDGPSGQHCVRVLPNGHLLMYDNGLAHHPAHSRAVEYALDVPNRTATMVWEYEPSPAIFTPIVGSAQRLSNGNTLVGFGYAGQMHEVAPNGTVVARASFSLHGNAPFYRAWRQASLYQYIQP